MRPHPPTQLSSRCGPCPLAPPLPLARGFLSGVSFLGCLVPWPGLQGLGPSSVMLVSRTQTLVFGASVEHSVAPQRVPYTVTCCPGALLVPAQGGLAGSSRSSTPWGPGSPPPGVCLRWFFKKLLGCLEHCTKKKKWASGEGKALRGQELPRCQGLGLSWPIGPHCSQEPKRGFCCAHFIGGNTEARKSKQSSLLVTELLLGHPGLGLGAL